MVRRYSPRLAILAAALLAALPAHAQIDVQVVNLGLAGRYVRPDLPLPVTVRLANRGAATAKFDLQVQVIYGNWKKITPGYTLHAAQTLAAGAATTVEVPMVDRIVPQPFSVVIAEARDADGRLLGESRVTAKAPGQQGSQLVAIVCSEDAICDRVQSAILFSGSSPERAAKRGALGFVVLDRVPAASWALLQAERVVVAKPEPSLNESERTALEWYARAGGQLLLIEDYLNAGKPRSPDSFLAPYRSAHPDGRLQQLGRGAVRDFSSESGPSLPATFTRVAGNGEVSTVMGCRGSCDVMQSVREGLGTQARFPGFVWVLGWMLGYILALGIVNFSVLHRLGRRQLAWITMPAISIIFAGGIYAATDARLPRQFQLDDLAVNWMDDRSKLAAIESEVRIAAPRETGLTLQLAGDQLFTDSGSLNQGGEFTDSPFAIRPVRLESARMGEHLNLDLRMVQRSFARLSFTAVRTMPGTVHRAGPESLENQTGVAFQRAIFASGGQVYVLGAVAAGAKVDLKSAGTVRDVRFLPGAEALLGQITPLGAIQQGPGTGFPPGSQDSLFTAVLLRLRNYSGLEESSPPDVFLGLSDGATADASLAGLDALRNEHALTVVYFGERP